MINIQSIEDNECFRWCFVRYLHPVDYNPAIIRKAGKCFSREIDFKDMNFRLKLHMFTKIKKKNGINISLFGFENKKEEIQSMCQEILSKDMLIYYC